MVSCSWTTTPSWPCHVLHFLTLFPFSCTLPHLSHATLLVFTCVCSAISWGGVGCWRSFTFPHLSHATLLIIACAIEEKEKKLWLRWCAKKHRSSFGKFQNPNFDNEDFKLATGPQPHEHSVTRWFTKICPVNSKVLFSVNSFAQHHKSNHFSIKLNGQIEASI